MSNYRRGRALEYLCAKELRVAGWYAQRTAGSRSPFDVIAWNRSGIRLIQVKKLPEGRSVEAVLKAAVLAWRGREWPILDGVSVELWIRKLGLWIVKDLREGM